MYQVNEFNFQICVTPVIKSICKCTCLFGKFNIFPERRENNISLAVNRKRIILFISPHLSAKGTVLLNGIKILKTL